MVDFSSSLTLNLSTTFYDEKQIIININNIIHETLKMLLIRHQKEPHKTRAKTFFYSTLKFPFFFLSLLSLPYPFVGILDFLTLSFKFLSLIFLKNN